MDNKTAKDLMVPLQEYPHVPDDADLGRAVAALDRAREQLPAGRDPYRAVLVVDHEGRVVGKIGQLALLKALEPQSSVLEDLALLTRAGVSDEFLAKTLEHHRLFRANLTGLCRAAAGLPVRRVMQPVTQSIEENASLSEALHNLVVWQTLSVLVTRDQRPVGLLRLSDLCREIIRHIKTAPTTEPNPQQE